MPKRARTAQSLLVRGGNAELCYEVFGGYLLKTHKDLVTDFLDLTGVEHEDGMIQNVDEAQPEGGKICDAVTELDGKFPPEDVTLYLSICAEQWPQVVEIQELWTARTQEQQ